LCISAHEELSCKFRLPFLREVEKKHGHVGLEDQDDAHGQPSVVRGQGVVDIRADEIGKEKKDKVKEAHAIVECRFGFLLH